MQGGTFYPENEKDREYYESEFYDADNGRPFTLPLERPKQNPEDPFANFKDFADITAGVDTDFSHHVVVYANKDTSKHEPRNILEQLELIDQQNDEQTEVEPSEPIKSATLSKFKTKLRSTKLQKEYKKFKVPKSSADYVDPLVADS